MIDEKKIRFIFLIGGLCIGVVSMALFSKTNATKSKKNNLSAQDVKVISERVYTMLAMQKNEINKSKKIAESTSKKEIEFKNQLDKSLQKMIVENKNFLSESLDTNSFLSEQSKFSASTFDEIEVRKDELLQAQNTFIYNLDFDANALPTANDSILASVSGIEIENTNEIKFPIVIEHWQSPIGFKGYKFSKNKLAIYGLSSQQSNKMFKYQNNYYLRSGKDIYGIRFTYETRLFDKISNSKIIAKLNAIK